MAENGIILFLAALIHFLFYWGRTAREVGLSCQSGQSKAGRSASSVSTRQSVSHQPPSQQVHRRWTQGCFLLSTVKMKWSAAGGWRDTPWTNWQIKAKWQQQQHQDLSWRVHQIKKNQQSDLNSSQRLFTDLTSSWWIALHDKMVDSIIFAFSLGSLASEQFPAPAWSASPYYWLLVSKPIYRWTVSALGWVHS